jgi:hypothetical protein
MSNSQYQSALPTRTEKGGRNSGEKNIKYKRPYTKNKTKKKQPCSKLY